MHRKAKCVTSVVNCDVSVGTSYQEGEKMLVAAHQKLDATYKKDGEQI